MEKNLDSYVLQEGDKTLTLTKKPYGSIDSRSPRRRSLR
jgi:hypothetical protein